MLRTGWTTLEQQRRFYEGNFLKDYKYWEFIENVKLNEESKPAVLAVGGFVHIKGRKRRRGRRRRGKAEIALIVHPQARGQGFGTQCAEWILHEGFANLGFKTIWGEAYGCGAVRFWRRIYERYDARIRLKRDTKYWEGWYFGSTFFSIDREKYYAKQERSIPLTVSGRDDRIADKPISTSPRIRTLDSGETRRGSLGDHKLEHGEIDTSVEPSAGRILD
jgi:GNAT superfamily N-acetyltransferase